MIEFAHIHRNVAGAMDHAMGTQTTAIAGDIRNKDADYLMATLIMVEAALFYLLIFVQ